MKLLWLALLSTAALAAAPKRPTVDLSAMREAMGVPTDETGSPFPSAASYAHFLRARLAHHDGDHKVALDELRLALASDDSNPYLMTELAEQYARSSELDRAELQLKRVIERFPDYPPAQLLMGRVLYEGQKTTRARTHLMRAIKLRPNDPDAYLVLTQLWLDQGRVEDAVKVVEELGSAVPGEPVGFRRLGLALAERSDPKAEKLLQRAVERDPGDIESWSALGRIYETAGKLPKALESWEQALEHDPDNRDVLLNAGRLALRLKKVADARAYFDQVLAQGRDPEIAVKVSFSYLAAHQLQLAADVLDQARANGQEPRLHFYAGLVHERVREFQKAADAFDAVPRGLGDVSYEARLHRGICLSQLGQHKAALEVLLKVREEKGELVGVDPAISRTQERAGQLKEAEATLVRAMGQGGASTELLEALAGFYGRQNRLQDAVSLLSGALARAPKDEALLFALASVHEKKGEWARAVEKVRIILDGDPKNATALNFMGYTLAQNGGDLEEAERLVRRALELKPDSPAFLDSLGWVLFKKGDADQGAQVLELAVGAGPEDATLFEHLGDVCAKLGRKQRAQECYSRSIELLQASPDDAERPTQKTDLERKLKLLSPEGKGR